MSLTAGAPASPPGTATAAAFDPVVRSTSLRESVTERLRAAIVTGEIAEGQVVSAPALGQQLGVSATPVREAMMDLARDGLVETVKNKGFRVTTVTDRELDELTEIRLLLEPPTVASVVGSVPVDGLVVLDRLADQCLAAAQAQDLSGFLTADRQFHAAILDHAGNAHLTELSTSLRRRTRMYGLHALVRQGKLADSAREHHQLLDLMRSGDALGCRELMARHISHARGIWAGACDPGKDR
ncbi:GntR family transcriptional regulator (plasmid) [Citricoccus sp. SGAir0253]|uniref:GntR family transcriptional regulator n=1 Tax=Citricoccus sp. SGAir0253 TaxID=2567881 RepID=UPI0010CCF1F9|nr:GntR family transcriptional regulator [Citricoccus sp. SGAir0253]QCU79634.1 GntR family transcriptional regulator [Citricoccus sp. SGAir0253]